MAKHPTPAEIFGKLFADLHKSGIWSDGKAISDAIPKTKPSKILKLYKKEKRRKDFNLKAFAKKHFKFQKAKNTQFKSNTSKPVEKHINKLWDVLTRAADKKVEGSSLLPLPHPYIVPGGRFNEIYYWDSYFTMLGLEVSGRIDLIKSMIDNFSHLIETVGFIPNGNRTYFMGRSQPPFYAYMVQLLAEAKGNSVYKKYLPFLEKEYQFWMQGSSSLKKVGSANKRVVQLKGGILNRYWDNFDAPRAEMYQDDIKLKNKSGRKAKQLYKDLRAACESGWDFSSRWLRSPNDLSTIHATEIIPIDLNCLLYNLEKTLQRAYQISNKKKKATAFAKKAKTRKKLIFNYLWDKKLGIFTDFDFVKGQSKGIVSAACAYPLFCKIATDKQAIRTAAIIKNRLLKPGGIVSTNNLSGQQWDAPNGWAPQQWIAIRGLRNYNCNYLADNITKRWTSLNKKVFLKTGKLLEKYNVENMDLETGGGEYPVQDGFGWTNGVLLKLLS